MFNKQLAQVSISTLRFVRAERKRDRICSPAKKKPQPQVRNVAVGSADAINDRYSMPECTVLCFLLPSLLFAERPEGAGAWLCDGITACKYCNHLSNILELERCQIWLQVF
jgi:hypothetical protein